MKYRKREVKTKLCIVSILSNLIDTGRRKFFGASGEGEDLT